MSDHTYFFDGADNWDTLERTRAQVDSLLYGLCEEAHDYDKKYQVVVEVTEIS